MINERQITLFDPVEYGGKKIRGHYKKKEKEIKSLNPYLELAQIRSELAGFLPIPISGDIQDCYTYGFINLWYEIYKQESYEYENEMFNGEDFRIIEAELIGTERLKVEQRLYFHKKLFELVKQGKNIQTAAEMLQDEIKKVRAQNGENNTVAKD